MEHGTPKFHPSLPSSGSRPFLHKTTKRSPIFFDDILSDISL